MARPAKRPTLWIVAGLGAAVLSVLIWLGFGTKRIETPTPAANVELAATARVIPAPAAAPAAPPVVPPAAEAPPIIVPVAAPPARPTRLTAATTARSPEKTRPARPKPAQKKQQKRPKTPPPIDAGPHLRCRSSALSAVEAAICGNPALAAAARQEDRLYAAILAAGDRRYATRATKAQASFLRRRERCKDEACIARVYSKQSEKLTKWRAKIDVRRARAAEKALPICTKAQKPSPTTCRASRAFSLRRLLS